MKRVTISIILILFFGVTFAQESPVDRLFEKYSGKEGYTSIFISEYMFTLFSSINTDNPEFENAVKGISGIKILTTETSKGVDFHREIMRDLPSKDYKELMIIREEGQNLTFLIKESKGKVIELLLVVGGGDNVLISIRGSNINLKTISMLSKSMDIDELNLLDGI